MKSFLSALFLSVLALACGPSGNYQQPYYQQQPVIVQPAPVYPAPIVVPMTPHQPVMVPNTVTTTTRRTTVAPVQVQQQPQQVVPRATMQPSQFQQQVAPATQNLNDRAGQVRSFQVQQGVQQKATGFGAKAAVPAPAPFRPAAAPAPAFKPAVIPAARPATQFRKPCPPGKTSC